MLAASPHHQNIADDNALGDPRVNNPMLSDSDGEEEDPDKPPAGTTATSREDLEAALQEVADSDLVPLEVKDLVAKMDSFYRAKVYEMKPHHSTHLHEAPTNWCASRDAAGA
jgi:hypothetical protein|eukprot:COSAG06_NODE_227_length_19736_cov_15.570708_15_plen_112_part_00